MLFLSPCYCEFLYITSSPNNSKLNMTIKYGFIMVTWTCAVAYENDWLDMLNLNLVSHVVVEQLLAYWSLDQN